MRSLSASQDASGEREKLGTSQAVAKAGTVSTASGHDLRSTEKYCRSLPQFKKPIS
jgi:hypothetical protein